MSRRLMLRNAASDTDLHITDLFCLDGIKNSLSGHDSNALTWQDLSEDSRTVSTTNTPVWGKNCLVCNGSFKTMTATIPLGITSSFSVEAVCKINGYSGSYSGFDYGWLFSNRYGYGSYIQMNAQRESGSGTDGISCSLSVARFTPPDAKELTHPYAYVVATIDKSKDINWYVNGELIATATVSSSYVNWSSTWCISGFGNTGTFPFVGNIYRLGIDSKVFTAAEIEERFQYFKNRFGLEV